MWVEIDKSKGNEPCRLSIGTQSNSKIQGCCLREKRQQQKRQFEDGILLFKDEKNAFSYFMIERSGKYPSSNIQQVVDNASLEARTSDLEKRYRSYQKKSDRSIEKINILNETLN